MASVVLAIVLSGLLADGPGSAGGVAVRTPAPSPLRAGGPGLGALPLAARGPISSLVGKGDPRFAIDGLRAHNGAQGLGLRFGPGGVAVAAGGARLRLGLSSYGRPGAMRPPAEAVPTASGNEVAYRHGGLTESYANGPLGLEQSFELASRPAAGRGPLTFLLHVSGASVRADGGSILIAARGQELRYGDLVVTDADGHRVPAALSAEGDDIAVKVDDAGAAYPLHVDPLLQKAVLLKPGAADTGYGFAVAIDGPTIAVGDPYAGGTHGTAYVFEEPAGGWATTEEPAATLVGDGTGEGVNGELFGHSVALSGSTLVVGAPSHKIGDYYNGAAYVFRAPSSHEWAAATRLARLESSNGSEPEGGIFGERVAISGRTVAVSAPGRLENLGAVFVYREPGGGWQSTSAYGALLHGPTFSEGQGCPQFGDGLAIAEHGSQVTAVVGEPGVYHVTSDEHDPCSHPLAGHVDVFTSPVGGWTNGAEYEGTTLSSGPGAQKDRFGESVAVSADGGFVLAGAPGLTVGGQAEAGAAYLFDRSSGGGTGSSAPAMITAPETFEGAAFGTTVALAADASRLAVDQPASVYDAVHGPEGHFKPASDLIYDRPAGGWVSTDRPSDELVGSEEEDLNVSGYGLGLEGETVVNGGSYDEAAGGTTVLVYGPGLGIVIEGPANGAEYTPGQVLTASYRCLAPAGATITKCEGPVASGQRIDTASEGAYAFTVNAEDSLGATGSRTVHYLVARASSNRPAGGGEPASKEGVQQTKTAAQIVAEEEAHAATLKREFKEFLAYVEYMFTHPAPIASILKNGVYANRSLVPEPAWIETSGKAFSWGLPKASANAMSLATASKLKGKKTILAFSRKVHVTKAGKAQIKIPLTAAGRKLAERGIAEHHPLKVEWTVSVRSAKVAPITRHFTAVYKAGKRAHR
ncbi:MAG TPA: hypothetical protein VMF55_12060 [Solirubrobacterales bacterium]|nr:hypothetical protein [Solirubrobacterales bacterium]